MLQVYSLTEKEKTISLLQESLLRKAIEFLKEDTWQKNPKNQFKSLCIEKSKNWKKIALSIYMKMKIVILTILIWSHLVKLGKFKFNIQNFYDRSICCHDTTQLFPFHILYGLK